MNVELYVKELDDAMETIRKSMSDIAKNLTAAEAGIIKVRDICAKAEGKKGADLENVFDEFRNSKDKNETNDLLKKVSVRPRWSDQIVESDSTVLADYKYLFSNAATVAGIPSADVKAMSAAVANLKDLMTDPTARDELTKMEKWLDNLGLIGVDFSNFTASFASAPNAFFAAFAELMAPPVVVHTGPPSQPQQQYRFRIPPRRPKVLRWNGLPEVSEVPVPPQKDVLENELEKVSSLAVTQKSQRPKENIISFMQGLYDSIIYFKEAMKLLTTKLPESGRTHRICRFGAHKHLPPITLCSALDFARFRVFWRIFCGLEPLQTDRSNLRAKMFNSRRVVQDNECAQLQFKQEVVGVTLTKLELTLVLTMYISAVVILVVVFEVLKPSLSAHLLGSN
ncbi:unnamed protein product [Caenorhabditis sp. 36 PRJEB53466]|nr:unnamed protein product [Caenorhabditis sp. 36 PRJEB53466]